MKKEDLDALAGLYEGVYSSNSGEYLSEDYIEEQGRRTGSNPNVWKPATTTSGPAGGGMGGRRGGGSSPGGIKPSTPSPAVKPAAAKPGALTPTTRPAAAKPGALTPTTRPAATQPAARPATPGSGAKVAPAAAKPAGQTGDKAKDMATWAKANPTLANKPKTPNPLMQKTFGYQTGGAPDQVAKTAAATATAGKGLTGTGALASKPTTPIKKPGAVMSSYEWPSAKTIRDIAGAYASIYEAKKKDQDQDGDNDFADVQIARMMASGMSKAEAIAAVKNKPYNEEVEIDEATLSAKAARAGKDIGAKGKNFAKIAASAGERYGSAEAGKRVAGAILKKMRANEEFELDEATRMRKELGKEGETATRKELAARSKAHKRSASVDKTIAAAERAADWSGDEKKAKALRGLAASRRGSVRDKPRAGLRGYAAKVEGGDKDLQTSRQKAMSAGTLTPKEKKQLGEVYEIVASYLLENNFAETLNDANVIIENMSEVWLSQILESVE